VGARAGPLQAAALQEHEPVAFDAPVVATLLPECILDLEEICEVGGGLDAHLEVERCGRMV
jgi:hypothetical protein